MTREEFMVWKANPLTQLFFEVLQLEKEGIDRLLLGNETPQNDLQRINFRLGQRLSLQHILDYVPPTDSEGE
jgi:hypothetical protein